MTLFNVTIFTVILILTPIAITGFSLAPWVPTRKKDLERINKIANLKKGEIFYELGSGNGKVSYYIAKNNPDVKVHGFELSFPLLIYSKLINLFFKEKNLKFKLRNIFKQDLSKADVIYVFGMPKVLENKLKEKILKEVKKGTRIISYTFKIEGLNPVKKDILEKQASIYLYEI